MVWQSIHARGASACRHDAAVNRWSCQHRMRRLLSWRKRADNELGLGTGSGVVLRQPWDVPRALVGGWHGHVLHAGGVFTWKAYGWQLRSLFGWVLGNHAGPLAAAVAFPLLRLVLVVGTTGACKAEVDMLLLESGWPRFDWLRLLWTHAIFIDLAQLHHRLL